MAIVNLAQLGRVEKEVEVNKDLKIKLHTLSVVEMQKALAFIPAETTNEIEKFIFMQQGILIQATETVNGEAVTKEQSKEMYTNCQHNLLTEIFVEYTTLGATQTQVLEDLKKK